MKADYTQLYELISDRFRFIQEKIEKVDIQEFQKVFGSALAEKSRNIVYVWLSESPVPRLAGESRILYIGQTKRSLKERHYRHAATETSSKANRLKYELILKKYGPIGVAVCPYEVFGPTLLEAEGLLLWWYFRNHGEYPPLNYTKTRIRKDSIDIGQGRE